MHFDSVSSHLSVVGTLLLLSLDMNPDERIVILRERDLGLKVKCVQRVDFLHAYPLISAPGFTR